MRRYLSLTAMVPLLLILSCTKNVPAPEQQQIIPPRISAEISNIKVSFLCDTLVQIIGTASIKNNKNHSDVVAYLDIDTSPIQQFWGSDSFSHVKVDTVSGGFCLKKAVYPMDTYYYSIVLMADSNRTIITNSEIDSLVVPMPSEEIVDMGTRARWRAWNLGANKVTECGDYYAWGEKEPFYVNGQSDAENALWKPGKEDGYWWTSNSYGGSAFNLTKYCDNPEYGIVDNKLTLELEDDAANIKLGGSWRIPTMADFNELRSHSKLSYIEIDGMKFAKLKCHENHNILLLPFAGRRAHKELEEVGRYCHYWTAKVNAGKPYYSRIFEDFTDAYEVRFLGTPIRPICD